MLAKQAERARAAAERKALAELDKSMGALIRGARDEVGNNKIQMARLKRFDAVCVYIYVCLLCVYICMCAYACIYAFMYVYLCMHECICVLCMYV